MASSTRSSLSASRSAPTARASGLGDIAQIRRAYVDPLQVAFAAPSGPGSDRAGISMAKGGDIIEMWARLCAARPMPSAPSCRWASSCASSRISRPLCRARWAKVRCARADRGGGDRSGGDFVSPRRRRRRASGSTGAPARWRGITIPLVLAITRDSCTTGAWACTRSRRLADHRVGLAGRRRDHRRRDDGVKASEEGYDKLRAATSPTRSRRCPCADRHADHRGGLPAHRHGQSRRWANTSSRSSPSPRRRC